MDRNLLVTKTPDFIELSKYLTNEYKSLRLAMFLPNYRSENVLDYTSYTMLLSAFEFDFKNEYEVVLEIFELIQRSMSDKFYNSIERISIIKSTDRGLTNLFSVFNITESHVTVRGINVNGFRLPDGIITHAKRNPLE